MTSPARARRRPATASTRPGGADPCPEQRAALLGATTAQQRPVAQRWLIVRTVSEANRRDHRHDQARRARQQHAAARLQLGPRPRLAATDWPVAVRLTRVSARRLDGDNLARALKAIQDATARWLGVDDGDEDRVTWTHAQERGPRGTHGVRVEVYARCRWVTLLQRVDEAP